MGFQRVPKKLFLVNYVTITATFFMSSEDARILKMRDNSHGSTLSDTNSARDIPHSGTRILCQAD